jgi:hypothetical protein
MTDNGFGGGDDVMPQNVLPYDNPADASASPEEDFVRHVMHLAEKQVEALWRGGIENVRANQIGAWSALWVRARDVLNGIHRGVPDISRRPPADRARCMPSTAPCQLDGDSDFRLEGR